MRYDIDNAAVKKIFESTSDSSVYKKIADYVEKLYPITKGMRKETKKEMQQNRSTAKKAISSRARYYGWIKPHHNACATSSLWSQEKKDEFKEYIRIGAPVEDIAQDKMFRKDFPKNKNWQILFHNYFRSVCPELRNERNKALEQKKIRCDQKKHKKEEEQPRLDDAVFTNPPILEVSQEALEQPGVRVGTLSRIDWKTKGSRIALIRLALEKILVPAGCHYNVLNGGLVDKKYVEKRVKKTLATYTPAQRRRHGHIIVENVLQHIAAELNSILPRVIVSRPSGVKKQHFIRFHITTSPILDGEYGERIAVLLDRIRPDIRLHKQGGDRTYLKGVGQTEEDRVVGQIIAWLNPRRHGIPGQFASTSIQKEIRQEEASAETLPGLWCVGGYGVSVSKPGGGEHKRPWMSLPILHAPIPRLPGDPAIALNQVGVRIIETDRNGTQRRIRTWSLRDLVQQERSFITGIKDGATELHKKIVDIVRRDKHGFTISHIADALGVDHDRIEREIQFLLEQKALRRVTWPGLYLDEESKRVNFHLDWLQERLVYPWPYETNFFELRRLIFGCLHAGYTSTDYEFVRSEFPKIILEKNITVVELVGDIVAGMKHDLINRGQIIGNLNYTEQERFAGELLATVFYDVFVKRFEIQEGANNKIKAQDLYDRVESALLLFLFIIGNHDEWQKRDGHIPGEIFRNTLASILRISISEYLKKQKLYTHAVEEIVNKKIVMLPPTHAVYEFPGGIKTELFHPSMARTKTVSIRLEEALEKSTDGHMVDVANFHTAIHLEKWSPEFGQRVATQVGAMCPWTDFEHGKLKTVDFGPIYSRILSKDGKIFMSEHEFLSQRIIKEPIKKETDIDTLKSQLKLLRSPT